MSDVRADGVSIKAVAFAARVQNEILDAAIPDRVDFTHYGQLQADIGEARVVDPDPEC